MMGHSYRARTTDADTDHSDNNIVIFILFIYFSTTLRLQLCKVLSVFNPPSISLLFPISWITELSIIWQNFYILGTPTSGLLADETFVFWVLVTGYYSLYIYFLIIIIISANITKLKKKFINTNHRQHSHRSFFSITSQFIVFDDFTFFFIYFLFQKNYNPPLFPRHLILILLFCPVFLIFSFRFFRRLLQEWERCSRCYVRITRSRERRRVVRSAVTEGAQVDEIAVRPMVATTASLANVRPAKLSFRIRSKYCHNRAI